MVWPSLRPFNIGGDANPYLRRWYVLPRNRWFCVYLHQMLRDDDPRALHDHPGANLSIVLRGGYLEHLFAWKPGGNEDLPPVMVRRRRPGAVVFRGARLAHRLTLPEGVAASWSLFVMVLKLRDWGFWCPGGRWVSHREFTAGERGELVGRGCDS